MPDGMSHATTMATLADGYHAVPFGKLAAVVTTLEMYAPPPLRPTGAGKSWRIRREIAPDARWYRELYLRIGRNYLWTSRLACTEDRLRAMLDDALVEIYAFESDGCDEGLVELDFRVAGACELGCFGVTPPYVGTAAARFMMNETLQIAWARKLERCWVHTCSLDHPAALDFYVRSGFRASRREIEIFDDPRLVGLLPIDAAPKIPILRKP